MGADEKRISSLIVKIRTAIPTLTASEKRVADFIVSSPEDVLQYSVSDLALKSQSSDATVIRTIRKLGINSYSEFKVLLAQAMVAPVKMLDSEIEAGDETADVVHKVYSAISNTLNMTANIPQQAEMEAAADALYQAKHIILVGFGNSASAVSDFQQKLMRLGLPTSVQFDPNLLLIDALNYASPETVCFAISHSGRTKNVIDIASFCQKKGCRVIALTDVAPSPLKDVADIVLCTMSGETKLNLYAAASKIAQYAILDVIYNIISYKHADSCFDRFEEVYENMKKLKVRT